MLERIALAAIAVYRRVLSPLKPPTCRFHPTCSAYTRDAIVHYSWVRSPEELRLKFQSWGHAEDRDWGPEFDYWMWARSHPYLAALHHVATPGPDWRRHLRVARIKPVESRLPAGVAR